MVKVSTTSVAIQTDLTWSNGEENYIKKLQTNKQIAKDASKQASKASQVSLDSRNPPKGLSGEPGPSKPTTGKDTEQLSKDAYSGRLKNRYETLAKHNPLAVCLQETFLRDTDNYPKCQETENRASEGVSSFVNENVPQSIVTLNTNLQAVAVKVTAHKTITLCSVYLPPRNHFNFNPKDLQSVIDQLPSPFILMGDFNGHHTLWGCEDVNNRGQQLEDLILKNDLILLNDKSHTYFHSASGTFTSIDLTLCSPSLFLDFSWKVGPDHFPILLMNDGPPSIERVQRWKLAKANWDEFQPLCSTRLQQSAISDADDPMSLFTSILKDIAEVTIPKTSAVPKRFNKPWFSDICKEAIKERNRALERFKHEPTESNLNAYRIARAKARRDIRYGKKTSWRNYVSKMNSQTSVKSVWNRIRKIKGKDTSSLTEMSRLIMTLRMHWQITFLIIIPLLSASVRKKAEKQTIKCSSDNAEVYNKPLSMESCGMLCVEPTIPQQDRMKYTISC